MEDDRIEVANGNRSDNEHRHVGKERARVGDAQDVNNPLVEIAERPPSHTKKACPNRKCVLASLGTGVVLIGAAICIVYLVLRDKPLKSSPIQAKSSGSLRIATLPSELQQCGRIQSEFADILMKEEYHGVHLRGRIIGGSKAKQGQFPWQAAIRFKEDDLYSHRCGGTLIHDQWVLSAAHCFVEEGFANEPLYHYDKTHFFVRLGDLHKDEHEGEEQDYDIKDLMIHEKFNFTCYRNDIALLRLNGTARYSKYVQPACLPTQQFRVPVVGEKCQASGWGFTENNEESSTLLYANIPKMSGSKCNEAYNVGSTQRFVGNEMICAGYEEGGIDSCWGDSGGPYVCRNIDGRYSLQGIVSFGNSCALKGFPGIYTNVRQYIPWITKHLAYE